MKIERGYEKWVASMSKRFEYNISWTWTNNDPRIQNYEGRAFDALRLIYVNKSSADGTSAWNEFGFIIPNRLRQDQY